VACEFGTNQSKKTDASFKYQIPGFYYSKQFHSFNGFLNNL